jgi:hypothetical protein
MTSLRTHATNFILATATVAAIGAALVMPGSAGAAPVPGHNPGEPWPEPPSCSNETGTCTSIEDMLAYECYFENPDSPFSFCDDPFELLRQDKNRLTTPLPDPDPAPLKLVAPSRR